MKKRLLSLIAAFLSLQLFLALPLYADEADDDFDALFEDAAADIVVEEAEVPSVENASSTETSQSAGEGQATIIIKEAASAIKFTGNFTSNVGLAATYRNDEWNAGGALTLNNTLYMNVKPASDFTLHMAVNTTESNLSLNLTNFYFDYLWKDVFISAGKKSLTWGNVRLFNSSTYGPVLTNIVSGIGPLVAEVQVPFFGDWTFVGGGNASSSGVDWSQMKYAAAYENQLGQTNLDLYATYATDKNAAGIELKRTIGGFDFYGQAICRYEEEHRKAVGTAGFYRLWETDGPEFGVNAEYQFVFDRTLANPENHKIAVETGIRKLGKKKNIKIGTQWGHNFTDGTGIANVALLFGSIFPHANWTNAVSLEYGDGFSNLDVKIGSTISLTIKY